LKLLNDQDLNPQDLARIVRETLTRAGLQKVDIDLNGAANTVQWLESWIDRNLKNS
jgi:predicted glycosyltransferase